MVKVRMRVYRKHVCQYFFLNKENVNEALDKHLSSANFFKKVLKWHTNIIVHHQHSFVLSPPPSDVFTGWRKKINKTTKIIEEFRKEIAKYILLNVGFRAESKCLGLWKTRVTWTDCSVSLKEPSKQFLKEAVPPQSLSMSHPVHLQFQCDFSNKYVVLVEKFLFVFYSFSLFR